MKRLMRWRISTYFVVTVSIVTAWLLFQNPHVGLAFAVAALAIILPLCAFPIPERYFYILLFTAGAVWFTHLLRVPFLLWIPESFMYAPVGHVTPDILSGSLYEVALYSALLLIGLAIGFRSYRSEGRKENFRQPFFLTASVILVILALIVICVRLYLQFGLGLHTKNVQNPEWGFLSRLLPDFLLYPLIVVYIFKYRKDIPVFELWLLIILAISLLVMIILSGSKSAVAVLAATIFIFYLAEKGNFRLNVFWALLLAALGAWFLVMTFAIASPLRSYLAAKDGYDDEIFTVVRDGLDLAFKSEMFPVLGTMVTQRISGGLDGMMAVEMERPQLVTEVFRPSRTLKRITEALIPRYGSEGVIPSGKAVGVAYVGHSMNVQHSSSLGLFAALRLTFGAGGSFLAVTMMGFLWASYFCITGRAGDPDLVFLLHFIGVYQLLAWLLSGNFDVLIPSIIGNLMMLGAYGGLAVVIVKAAQAPRPDHY